MVLKLIVLVLLFSSLACGCMSLVYYEGSYHGQVIDAGTLEPIEGAVVLAVWSKAYYGAGGVVHEYYDTRETLTDRRGEFTIKGMGPRAMTRLEKMNMVVFKAGYADIGVSWETLKKSDYYKDRVKWEGSKAVIMLDRWTLEQRRKRLMRSYRRNFQ